jgi:autotransporter-associated beta strand protein
MLPNARLAALSAALLVLLSPTRSSAQNYTWTSPAGGSWVDGTNWGSTPGDYPSTSDHRAFFSAAGSSAAKTVTLDGAVTVRRLIFNTNQTGAVTITPGTGGVLTLDSIETGQPTLDVQAGSGAHSVTANMTLVGPIAHKWNIAAGQTFTVTGDISGTQGITKLQAGTLLLNGTNTYAGPTTVSAGTLGGSGSIAGPVSVAVGAAIAGGASSSAPTLTLGNGLTLSGTTRATLFANDAVGQLVVTSGLTSVGGSLEVVLGPGVTVESFRAGGPRSYTIIDAASGQLSGTFSATDFSTAGFAPSEWAVAYDGLGGNVVLHFTPVPEPATVLGVAAVGLLGALGVRRWRAARAAAVAG